MITYKIKSQSKDNVVLVKEGAVTEFDVNSVKTNLIQLEKMIKELTAQISLEDAKISNYVHFYPAILKRSTEEINAIALYQRSAELKANSEIKLKECKKALKRFNQEKKLILEQTGIEI